MADKIREKERVVVEEDGRDTEARGTNPLGAIILIILALLALALLFGWFGNGDGATQDTQETQETTAPGGATEGVNGTQTQPQEGTAQPENEDAQ